MTNLITIENLKGNLDGIEGIETTEGGARLHSGVTAGSANLIRHHSVSTGLFPFVEVQARDGRVLEVVLRDFQFGRGTTGMLRGWTVPAGVLEGLGSTSQNWTTAP